MNRRIFISVAASGATIGIAGCSGGSSDGSDNGDSDSSETIVSGSTDFERTWDDVQLEEGDELELELTLDTGIYALANVSRNDNANDVATLDTEEKETITEQFRAPETVDYFVVLQVTENESGNGDASLALRRQ